jgi:hypothetical protein
MEPIMTNDLPSKATALLEARKNGTPNQMRRHYDDDGRVVIDPNICVTDFSELDDADFYVLAANTSTEIITGYQDLVRRMADAMEESYKRLNAAGYAVGEARIALLEEARAAIPHTSTES